MGQARLILFLLIVLLAGSRAPAAEALFPETRTPTASELEHTFNAPASLPWSFTKNSPESTRRLETSSVAAWDLRGLEALSVQARVLKSTRQAVRARWIVVSRLGWYETPAQAIAAAGAPTEVRLELPVERALLTPVGHQHPWDELAAAEVVALELRTEVTGGQEEIEVEALNTHSEALARGKAPAPRILDAAFGPPPPNSSAAVSLNFHIDPLPEDPFAASGDGDVRVFAPGGEEALCYLDEDGVAVADGRAQRLESTGAPVFRAHLNARPKSGTLKIVCGEREWTLPVEALAFVHTPAVEAGFVPRWKPPTLALLPPPVDADDEKLWSGAPQCWKLDPPSGKWQLTAPPYEAAAPAKTPPATQPPQTSTPPSGPQRGPGAPETTPHAAALHALRPALFWNAGWANYAAARRPDFEQARYFDALLARSANEPPRPLVVLDGETFGRKGVFNWFSHPLNISAGGRLTGAGALLDSDAGLEFAKRSARYAIARWGKSKAVSAFLMTVQLNGPAAPDLHARFAASAAAWPEVAHGLKPLLSLHPLAREPETISLAGPFVGRDSYGLDWQSGPPTASKLKAVPLQANTKGEAPAWLELTGASGRNSLCALKAWYTLTGTPYNKTAPDDFGSADALLFEVWIPNDAPADLRAGVHLRDRDQLWFQALLPGLLRPGDWTTCMLDLSGANRHGLTPGSATHQKPWTDYSRQRVTELGLHVYSTHSNQALEVRFANVRAVKFEHPEAAAEPRRIEVLDAPNAQPHKGEVWECHLKLNHTYANPFDARQVDLIAIVRAPSGALQRVPAFFDQPCARHEVAAGGAEVVEPVGAERWTVRYRVQEEGAHTVKFELREGGSYEGSRTMVADRRFTPDGQPFHPVPHDKDDWVYGYDNVDNGGRRAVDKVKFTPGNVTAQSELTGGFTAQAAARPWRGFLRVDADQRSLRFDDGTYYYALGPCARSPSDNRLPFNAPQWNEDFLDKLAKRGTYQFDEYFAAFEKAGINWTRVWMCSWWVAPMWRRDWPGYQGFGRYNMLNAWRLDHLLDEAEKHDLHISLCLNNHGQFSYVIDTEWRQNPYNAELGGPLNVASEFFSRGEAKAAHMNTLRYIAARWGHSPAVLAWDLFSELEFTDEYRPCLAPAQHGQPDAPDRIMEQWHAEMGEFLKTIDPNKHLVASHFSHPVRGRGVLAMPQVDIATSNAYSAFDELDGGKNDAPAALRDFWNGNQYPNNVFPGFKVFKKPALVEEQGRHWMGVEMVNGRPTERNTREQLDADLHSGLWGSLMQPLAGATGYWWWLHVHFDDRYFEYRALSAFLKGEDLRSKKNELPLDPGAVQVTSPENQLVALARRSQERAYVWVYHKLTPFQTHAIPDVANAKVALPSLKPGVYAVEFWDTREGKATGKLELTLAVNSQGELPPLSIALPMVKKDLAIKVKWLR